MQICVCPTSTCDSCYSVTVGYCPSNITFMTSFQPSITLYIWLQDKFGNVYNQTVVTNSDGSLSLDFTQYPVGFFTNNSGFFYLYMTSDALGNDVVQIPYGVSPELSCIVFTISDPVYFVDETGCFLFTDEDGQTFLIKE